MLAKINTNFDSTYIAWNEEGEEAVDAKYEFKSEVDSILFPFNHISDIMIGKFTWSISAKSFNI